MPTTRHTSEPINATTIYGYDFKLYMEDGRIHTLKWSQDSKLEISMDGVLLITQQALIPVGVLETFLTKHPVITQLDVTSTMRDAATGEDFDFVCTLKPEPDKPIQYFISTAGNSHDEPLTYSFIFERIR